VDQDANIIVGATFDEGLDGVIRVSVVATGIDQASVQRSVTEPETRIAELTQKLRAGDLRGDVQRAAGERIETRPHASPAMAAPAVPMADAIEAAAKAAVAAAVLPMIEDVTIRPIPPKPSLFPEQMALPSDPPPTPRAFIPPAPERTVNRPRRMPGIDELPRPGQAELRAKRGEAEIDNPEKRKVSLLRRLAAVGLGRRDEFEDAEKMPPNVRPVRPPAAPRMDRPIERPAAAPPPPPRPTMAPPVMPPMMPRGGEPISDYAKRPSQQGLDSLTRPAPAQPPVEEDQLDIPAFLRRQAN
jgi:cell division protein FtsZ